MTDSPPTTPGGDTVVYVPLLDEGVDVQRPVIAAKEGDGYRLPPEAPLDERWEIPPGSLARCEMVGGELHAVERL